MILENQVHDLMNPGGPVDPPEPPPLGEDELPVGGWGVITNLEDRDVQLFPITRIIQDAYFDPNPNWVYGDPVKAWPVQDQVEGNAWVICEYAGKWYMSTYEWIRPYQTNKPGVTWDNIADHTKKWQLQGWIPKAGDTLYFFCTTHVRNGTTSPQPAQQCKEGGTVLTWWQAILATIAPKVVDLFGKVIDKIGGKKKEEKDSSDNQSSKEDEK